MHRDQTVILNCKEKEKIFEWKYLFNLTIQTQSAPSGGQQRNTGLWCKNRFKCQNIPIIPDWSFFFIEII